ncbi:hypothetical protein CHLRE_08g364726v5 [Chlamydomonas reinhardtii]|uniref:Uncharacterized protein n=1 Tax=Chlamydomonas reinhardtii TaxID=3055 RepID=A0A2K3DGT9_CHLRE|nr:uncharacterized protein CHLRE_08g364726v5 [Chlamydomonas reinhardtii]PNW79727.1 hypothetical protein CHLRE_08g364726v5 [Chlamydomonas reinhardtii]
MDRHGTTLHRSHPPGGQPGQITAAKPNTQAASMEQAAIKARSQVRLRQAAEQVEAEAKEAAAAPAPEVMLACDEPR